MISFILILKIYFIMKINTRYNIRLYLLLFLNYLLLLFNININLKIYFAIFCLFRIKRFLKNEKNFISMMFVKLIYIKLLLNCFHWYFSFYLFIFHFNDYHLMIDVIIYLGLKNESIYKFFN